MSPEPVRGESPEPATFNLLFVCTGNTCRSPLAMAIARRAVRERGWHHVAAASAGVAAREGSTAADPALAVAAESGLELARHRSRPLTPDLVEWADLILTMSPGHLERVGHLGGAEKADLLTAFAGDLDRPAVPDPFGGDLAEYRATYVRLSELIERVLERLEPILSP